MSVGLTLVVMTSISGGLVDKAGRRSLMLFGTLVMALALATLSGALFWLNGTPRAQGRLVSTHGTACTKYYVEQGFGGNVRCLPLFFVL